MKPVKIFIVFTFLLAFALQVSAQDKTPKIVWKNLQEKYERFEDVKPVITNAGELTIFMFDDVKLGVLEDYLELYRYYENSDSWGNALDHGHPTEKKFLEKIMSNFKLQSQQARTLVFDEEDWFTLTESSLDRIFGFRGNPNHKGKGKYKFKFKFFVGEKKSGEIFTSESPVFEITEEQKSYFDK